MPNCVASFQKDLVNDTLRFSNLSFIYNKKMKNFILKSKTNGLFNINIYVKCLPNLSYGIIYISTIEKLKDNQFLIILDNNFRINAMSDPLCFTNGEYASMNKNVSFGLNNNIINHHIAILIPEILKQIKYEDQKFILCKNDIDLKGILYPNVDDFASFESNVDTILERIKQSGQLISEDNINPVTTITRETISRTYTKTRKEKDSNIKEYNELIDNLREKFEGKTLSIFYKIVMKCFLNGKNIYYRLYLTKDILGTNDGNIRNDVFKLNTANSNVYGNSLTNMGTKVSNESNIFQLPYHIENKERAIKIHIPNNKVLLGNNNEVNNNDVNLSKQNKNNNIDNNVNNVVNNDNNIPEHLSQNSFLTKSSVDSASFNKLKGRILNKNEPFFITYMKILSIFYLIITMVLTFFNNESFISTYNKIDNYLKENYFFNDSKIIINCIYLTGVNLKFIKYGAIKSDGCLGGNCSVIYLALFSECLDMIKNSTEDIAYYDNDYKEILQTTVDLEIYIYSLNVLSNITIDTPNLLNFILSNGLRLKGNMDTYFNDENDTIYEVFEENILNCSFTYITNEIISGFNKNKRVKNLKSRRFQNNYIYIIINAVCFIGIFTCIIHLLYKAYIIEIYFLKKLVMFHSNNFDNYIKYLEELKKKLRNDNGDDEQSELKNDSNENQVHNETSFNREEKNIEKKLMKETTKNDSNNDSIEKDKLKEKNKRKNKRKMHGRQSKIQQQKNEKIQIMAKYFTLFSIILSIKLCTTLIISMLYYIVILLFYNKTKNNLLSIDNITSNIVGIFRESGLVFSILKNQTLYLENFEIEKQKYINQIKNGIISNITIKNKTYTIDNIEELNSLNYSLIIPSTSELYINKIGNILMPLVSGSEYKGNKSPYGQLYTLYYSDMCQLLYSNVPSILANCNSFWSGIMKQGLEQTITQLGIELNTILEDFIQINQGNKTLIQINDISGALGQIEVFVNYFFLNAYSKTSQLFYLIKKDKKNNFRKLCIYINIIFIFCNLVLMFIMVFFIYSGKHNLNSFLNFIGIFPIQYLSEDENFYKETLKLEGEIFE